MLVTVSVLAAIYLAIGVAFTFIGPAAREMQRELARFVSNGSDWSGWPENPDDPAYRASVAKAQRSLRWRCFGFGATLAAGIVLAWPILVRSAGRAERRRQIELEEADWEISSEPSEQASAQIAEINGNPPRTISLEEYNAIGGELSYSDREFIRTAMKERGYLVAMATTEDGTVLPVRFNVAHELGMPIVLKEVEPGVWTFTTDSESWEHLAGASGPAYIENGVVVDVNVMIMS